MTRPTLRRVVPDTFLDAPDYNWNFDQLLDYAEDIETTVTEIESEITGTTVVIGTIIWYAGNTAPTGYLICNGSAISRNDYADLFAKINTSFGTGDGTTTFNIPDLIGKVAYGSATMNENLLKTDIQDTDHEHYMNHVQGAASGGWNTGGQTASHKHTVPGCGLLPCIKY